MSREPGTGIIPAVKCPACGSENLTTAKRCGGCRAELPVRATPAPRARATREMPGAPARLGPTRSGKTTKVSKTGKVATVKHPAAASPAPSSAPAPPLAPAKGHLLVRAGAPPLELRPGEVFTIGRQSSCSLQIPSKRISRVHAEIRWEKDRPVLSDKGSANGVFVGGNRITDHRLAPGDEVEIGPFLCVYEYVDPGARTAPIAVKTGDADDEASQTVAEQVDALSGVIDSNGLAEVLQGLELGRKSGTLKVFARRQHGWITVHEGVPLAALWGEATDDVAALKLLGLTEGRFSFSPLFKATAKSMTTTITGLLLEWSRHRDARAP